MWASQLLTIVCAAPIDVEHALARLHREDHGAHGTFVRDGSSTSAAPYNATAPTICTVAPPQRACDLSDMPRDTSYLVRPGGATRCIFSTTTPFQFEVIRGASDKVVFFFQGGGACWDFLSTSIAACNTGAFAQGPQGGIFDRNPESSNPFRDYTLVHVLYCDGSVHGGNVTRPYRDKAGRPVQQTGYANARSVVDWVSSQIVRGELTTPLSSLVISGCSAGSIGAQLWADHILTRVAHQRAAVVPDSYAGVFPSTAEGPLIYDFGFCTSALLAPLPAAIREACQQRVLSLHQVTAAVIARHPRAAFAHVQSKTDDVQIAFDEALSADPTIEPATGCSDAETCFTGPARFYRMTNLYFELYDERPNHVHFLVQASQHCYLPNHHVYTADPSGASAGGKGGERLIDWLARLPLRGANASIATRCSGAPFQRAQWHGDEYCDASMAGKVFYAPDS